MSEIASYIASQLMPVAKQYGVKRVLNIVSGVSFFLLAFVFWAEVFVLLCPTFLSLQSFSSDFVFAVGTIALIATIAVSCATSPLLGGFTQLFMRKMENASADVELSKSIAKAYDIIPVLDLIGRSTLRRKHLIGVLVFYALDISATFSLLALLATYGKGLISTLVLAWEILAQTFRLPSQPINGLTFLLLSLTVLSLYFWARFYSVETRFLKANKMITLWFRFNALVGCLVSSILRLGLFSGYIAQLAYSLSSSRLYFARYMPFLISSNIELIVQKSFNNVQGKHIGITKYECSIGDEKELSTLTVSAKEFFGSTRRGQIVTGSFDRVKSIEVANILKQEEGKVYTGFIEKQCVFCGSVYFGTSQKARAASFFFRNKFVMEEFQAIVQKQIEDARRL